MAESNPPINLSGTWKVGKSENLDAFLKTVGFNFAKRKLALAAPLTVVITQDGANVKVSNQSPIRTMQTEFEVGGREFEENTPDGRKVTAKAFWEGSSLVIEAQPKDKEKSLKVVRTLVGEDQMDQTMTCEGVTAIRHFSKVD